LPSSCQTQPVAWFVAPYSEIFWCNQSLGLQCWVHISLQIPTSVVGVTFITPVIARHTISINYWPLSCSHCIWPSATKPWSCMSTSVWSPWCKSNALPWVSDPMFYQMCPYRFKEPCMPCSSYFSAVPSLSKPDSE
jgi:hypothetical protein